MKTLRQVHELATIAVVTGFVWAFISQFAMNTMRHCDHLTCHSHCLIIGCVWAQHQAFVLLMAAIPASWLVERVTRSDVA